MVEPSNKSPCSGPGESLQVEIAYVIKNIIVVAGYSSNYKQFIFVENGSMSCSSFRDRPGDCWLGPMGRLEVKYYEIGEVGSMFVFAAEDE